MSLAEVHLARGDGPRALELAQRSIRLLREDAPEEPGDPSARRRHALLESRAQQTRLRAEELVWQR